MKIFKWVALAVVVLVVIGLVGVYLSLNSIVRSTVQRQSTQQLNVQTHVGGASVSLFGGNVGLDDYRVASPPGFEAENIFRMDDIDVDVRLGELRQDPVTVRSIAIRNPTLVIEQRGGTFNFRQLMDNMPQTPQTEGEPLRLIISNLSVSNATVVLRPGVPGLPPEMTVQIPPIALQDIGTGEGAENGAAVKDVVMLLVTTLTSEAYKSDLVPAELKALLEGDLKATAMQLASQQLGKVTEELREKLPPEVRAFVGSILDYPELQQDPGKAIEQGVRGLLGGTTQPATTQPGATTQPTRPGAQEVGRTIEGLIRRDRATEPAPKE
jgi:hypothetical protein